MIKTCFALIVTVTCFGILHGQNTSEKYVGMSNIIAKSNGDFILTGSY